MLSAGPAGSRSLMLSFPAGPEILRPVMPIPHLPVKLWTGGRNVIYFQCVLMLGVGSRKTLKDMEEMMIDQIGIDAGKIWNELELNGEMTTGALKKSLGMAPFNLNIAIGWLAREDKVSLSRNGNTIKLQLK